MDRLIYVTSKAYLPNLGPLGHLLHLEKFVVVVVVVGGWWWLRPVLGFSLSQAEQKYFSKYGKSNNLQDFPIYYRYSSIS